MATTDVTMHPAATGHLPGFITAPGETDVFFVGCVIFLIILVMTLGALYFWLHSIPERIAHGTGRLQFQLVGVLALLALFTHNNLFWVMALLLALVPIPDFWALFSSMADSLASMARRSRAAVAPVEPAELPMPHSHGPSEGHAEIAAATEGHKP